MGIEYEAAAFRWSLVLITAHSLHHLCITPLLQGTGFGCNISAMGCVLLSYCGLPDIMLAQSNNKNTFCHYRVIFTLSML